jgi:hypothetical protein
MSYPLGQPAREGRKPICSLLHLYDTLTECLAAPSEVWFTTRLTTQRRSKKIHQQRLYKRHPVGVAVMLWQCLCCEGDYTARSPRTGWPKAKTSAAALIRRPRGVDSGATMASTWLRGECSGSSRLLQLSRTRVVTTTAQMCPGSDTCKPHQ